MITWRSTARLLARSALFPASAITMFGLACRCSSFTQFFARVNVSLKEKKKKNVHNDLHVASDWERLESEVLLVRNHQLQLAANGDFSFVTVDSSRVTHCVGDVKHHDGSLGSPVVHGCKAVIPLLPRSVPDLKLDCRVVQTYRLREEGGWRGNEQRR